jgi:hypothetical protein
MAEANSTRRRFSEQARRNMAEAARRRPPVSAEARRNMAAGQVRRRGTLLERWSRNVKKSDDCWIWTGYFDGVGYGQLCVNSQKIGAHRLSYKLFRGMIPSDLFVCHTCDVRACVNPTHLFLGTVEDNNRDMHQKGRARGGSTPGETNKQSKMTWAQADEIRRLYAIDRKPLHGSHKQGRYRIRDIAEIVGVSVASASNVVRGRNWVRR